MHDSSTLSISTPAGALSSSFCSDRKAGMLQDILLANRDNFLSVFPAEAFAGAFNRLCNTVLQKQGLLPSSYASVTSCI